MHGSALLVAGEPGVGKSTLLLQVADSLADGGHRVLYASGEESSGQIKARADRLNTLNPQIWLTENIELGELKTYIKNLDPDVVIVDSLQMLYSAESKRKQGTPSQMRDCLSELIDLVKKENRVLVVIGHSTKSGLIAGLLTLQHMVDVTLFMTSNEVGARVIRANKNRFGDTRIEWKIIMGEHGLVGIEEDLEKMSEKVTVKYQDIMKVLKSGTWLDRHVIRGDFKWIFEKLFGKEKAEKISGYDIIYKVRKEE